jgi:dihydrofolate reductase
MRKLIITEWLSLDGIYDAASMPVWWLPFDSLGRQQYIQETINTCSAMLFGRKTYEMLYPYWSSCKNNEQGVADQLNNCQKYVLSKTLSAAPWKNSLVICDDWLEKVKELKQEAGGPILVQGSSSLVKPLLEAGLADELKLLVNPAVTGNGQRLFPTAISADLGPVSVRQFDKSVVLLTYQPLTQ